MITKLAANSGKQVSAPAAVAKNDNYPATGGYVGRSIDQISEVVPVVDIAPADSRSVSSLRVS